MAQHAVRFFILLNIHLGIALTISCDFGTFNVLNIPTIAKVYACKGKIDYRDTEKLYITGTHDMDKNDSDIKGLQIVKQKLSFFIKNIDERFPNLEQIDLSTNEIINLTNDDLEPFKNLEYFMIKGNNINSLNKNIFDNLPKLKAFYLDDNNLMHVQHDITLPNTVLFYFENNSCISQNAINETQIEELELNFLVKCPPTLSQIEENLETRENFFTYLINRNLILKKRLRFLKEKNEKILEAFN